MKRVDTEKKDKKTLNEIISKDHDAVYLQQFAYAELALLDLIDNEVPEKDKERLAAIVQELTEPDLQPLQAKIDKATYELMLEGEYRATAQQQKIVEERKGRLDLNRLVSRKACNKLLTNYLLVNKRMPVSKELRNSLHTNGYDDLVELIDKLQATATRDQSHSAQQEQKRVKAKTLKLKM